MPNKLKKWHIIQLFNSLPLSTLTYPIHSGIVWGEHRVELSCIWIGRTIGSREELVQKKRRQWAADSITFLLLPPVRRRSLPLSVVDCSYAMLCFYFTCPFNSLPVKGYYGHWSLITVTLMTHQPSNRRGRTKQTIAELSYKGEKVQPKHDDHMSCWIGKVLESSPLLSFKRKDEEE